MTRVSRRKIEQDIWERIWEIFLNSLSSLKKENVSDFVDDLLTEAEKVMIAKRLAVALMLLKEYNPQEISDTLKISPTTVNTIKRWLNVKGTGYRSILLKIITLEQIERFFQTLDLTLYKAGHSRRWDIQPIKAKELRKRKIKRLL